MLESFLFLQQYEQHSRQGSPPASGRRPLDEQTLRMLPKVVVSPGTLRRLHITGSGVASCVICQEDYVLGQRLVQLPCDHTFCANCGCQWLRQSNACPVCRRTVEPLDPRMRPSHAAWNSVDMFAFRHLPQGSSVAAVRRARETGEDNQQAELWPPVEDMARLAEPHTHWQEGSMSASNSRGGRVVTPPLSTIAASPAPGSTVAEETVDPRVSRLLRLLCSSSSAPVRRSNRASLPPLLRLPPVTTSAVAFSQLSPERQSDIFSRRSSSNTSTG